MAPLNYFMRQPLLLVASSYSASELSSFCIYGLHGSGPGLPWSARYLRDVLTLLSKMEAGSMPVPLVGSLPVQRDRVPCVLQIGFAACPRLRPAQCMRNVPATPVPGFLDPQSARAPWPAPCLRNLPAASVPGILEPQRARAPGWLRDCATCPRPLCPRPWPATCPRPLCPAYWIRSVPAPLAGNLPAAPVPCILDPQRARAPGRLSDCATCPRPLCPAYWIRSVPALLAGSLIAQPARGPCARHTGSAACPRSWPAS